MTRQIKRNIQERTRIEMIRKINKELPIFILWNHMLEKKLVSQKAYTNPYIRSGEIVPKPIDIEQINLEKDKRIPYYCFFHPTKQNDSTNFVLATDIDPSQLKDEDKQGNYYSCFGCDHGAVLRPVQFYIVMRFGISPKSVKQFSKFNKLYGKALEELAALMGIPYDDDGRVISDEEKKELRFREMYKRAAEIYHENLFSKNPYSKVVLAYLFQERGFHHIGNDFYNIIRQLKIGCAPDKYNHTLATSILLKEGYTEDELVESGISRRIDDEKIVDWQRQGMTLPYEFSRYFHNIYRRIIISRKGLTEEDYQERVTKAKKWKHMKLPIPLAHPVNMDATRRYPYIVIVEGELDYITWLALGLPYVISVGGTNGLDRDHIHQLLYQYEISNGEKCKTVYVALDEDGPGQEAVHKVAKELEKEGNFDIRILRLRYEDPETKEITRGDSNDFLVKFGLKAKDIFLQLMDEAISYPAFQFIKKVEAEQFVSDTQKLGFVRRNRKMIDEIQPDEKLFLALEIAKLMDVPAEWLVPTWSIAPAISKTKEEAILPSGALDKIWLTIFTNEEMYNACREYAKNSVLFKDPYVCVEAIKKHPNLQFLAIHKDVPDAYRDIVFHSFPNLQFRVNLAEKAQDVEDSLTKQHGYLSLYKHLENPYVNEVS